MLERVVFPSIGSIPVREITPTHVLGILQKTAKRGAPTVAAEARRTMSAASLRQALKVLGWSGAYSPHATRTSGSTRLNEMGYRPDAIEAQLAHADQNNVRRTYNHATYFDERRAMMQEWADRLDEWKEQAQA